MDACQGASFGNNLHDSRSRLESYPSRCMARGKRCLGLHRHTIRQSANPGPIKQRPRKDSLEQSIQTCLRDRARTRWGTTYSQESKTESHKRGSILGCQSDRLHNHGCFKKTRSSTTRVPETNSFVKDATNVQLLPRSMTTGNARPTSQ